MTTQVTTMVFDREFSLSEGLTSFCRRSPDKGFIRIQTQIKRSCKMWDSPKSLDGTLMWVTQQLPVVNERPWSDPWRLFLKENCHGNVNKVHSHHWEGVTLWKATTGTHCRSCFAQDLKSASHLCNCLMPCSYKRWGEAKFSRQPKHRDPRKGIKAFAQITRKTRNVLRVSVKTLFDDAC